jgi:hypothetical protein
VRAGSQGVGPQGVGPQGVGPQGVGPHGVGPQGMGPQGVGPQGVGPQGVGPQGVGPQGAGPPKYSPHTPQGVWAHIVGQCGPTPLRGARRVFPRVGPRGPTWAHGVGPRGLRGLGPPARAEHKGGGKILAVTPLRPKSLLDLSRDQGA